MENLHRKFRIKFNEQMKEEVPRTGKSKVSSIRLREDRHEFIKGMRIFWERCHNSFEAYSNSETAKLGAGYHANPFKFFSSIEESLAAQEKWKAEDWQREVIWALEDHSHIAFDIYATIRKTKPDRIVTLINGAAKLGVIASNLGFESNNYLSIHRNTQQPHRSDLPSDIAYHGKSIVEGSTVLLLEDVSDLGKERTYWEARKWLASRGVSSSPVFLEKVISLNEFAAATRGKNAQYFIEQQDKLSADNCYNSFATYRPHSFAEFWAKGDNLIGKALDSDPKAYNRFFNLIRGMGKTS